MRRIAWEFIDGSGGYMDVANDDADALALEVCEDYPNARVWIDEDEIQRGFIAADERGEP